MAQVVEFVVCHDDKETAFKANSTTQISKVWKSYITHRKWSDHEAQAHRMFINSSTGVKLSGTVASNHVKSGDKIWVYQLDPVSHRVLLCQISRHLLVSPAKQRAWWKYFIGNGKR
mgnify:CR=1 FL=1